MKRKLFAVALAATLVVAQGIPAFAAGSAETGNQQVTESDGKVVVETSTPGVTLSTVGSSSVDSYVAEVPEAKKEAVKTQLADALSGKLTSILDTLSESKKAELQGFTQIKTPVLDVSTDKEEITLKVPEIPENASVFALHLNLATGVWETIAGIKNGENYTFKSAGGWSPVVIVYKANTVTSPDGSSGGGASPSGVSDSGASPSGVATSPQTGVTSDSALWMSMAAVLLCAAGVVFRRTKRA